jgi:hypothetical protein
MHAITSRNVKPMRCPYCHALKLEDMFGTLLCPNPDCVETRQRLWRHTHENTCMQCGGRVDHETEVDDPLDDEDETITIHIWECNNPECGFTYMRSTDHEYRMYFPGEEAIAEWLPLPSFYQ